MKILHVCSASQLIYGAAHSLMTLAKAQREAAKTVEFVAFKGKQFAGEVREQGFTVHEVRVRAKLDPLASAQIARIVREGGFDVVHTHLSTSSVNGCLSARWAKVPGIATVHGMSSKHSYAFADHLIGVSDGVKQHLIDQGVAAEKISVVYNGLELPVRVEQELARGLIGIPRDALVLGTVSRVTPLKGIEDAIRAFARLAPRYPKLMYVVVGDGDALEGCKSLAAALGVADRVRFEGYCTNVPLYLSAMDLFVFPSHKEAMGIALVEAMAASLPSVASDIDGIPEVLTDESGLLVPVRNPEALSVAIEGLLRSPELRSKMGAAARKRAEDVFSATAMERSTDWVYREALGLDVVLPTPAGTRV